MDIAYDHIQEEVLPDGEREKSDKPQPSSLNTEFKEAYKVISSSPWGARLGGFLGSVKKQGETYYTGASENATKGLTDLRSSLLSRTRSLSLNKDTPDAPTNSKDASTEPSTTSTSTTQNGHPGRPESLPADIVKEAQTMVSRFRYEAAKRLKDIEKAEDAADEALLKFGTNIRNFLRDAVTIAPPSDDEATPGDGSTRSGNVLFESKDADGRRVIHTTRFDAQLHVIHSSLDSFAKDPASPQYEAWARDFDVEKTTEEIARDLEAYEELRRAMEKLVPEKVEYAVFWMRYYFLRHVVESEERRRRELLKGAATAPEEEIAWDEDSSDNEEDNSQSPTPNPADRPTTTSITDSTPAPNPAASQETIRKENDLLKPTAEPRRSHDQHSQADSDASYDLVSGATSRAPGSPKEEKKPAVAEESDEEDWE